MPQGLCPARSNDVRVERAGHLLKRIAFRLLPLSSLSRVLSPYDRLKYRASLLILTRKPALLCPTAPAGPSHPPPCPLPLGQTLLAEPEEGSRKEGRKEETLTQTLGQRQRDAETKQTGAAGREK